MNVELQRQYPRRCVIHFRFEGLSTVIECLSHHENIFQCGGNCFTLEEINDALLEHKYLVRHRNRSVT